MSGYSLYFPVRHSSEHGYFQTTQNLLEVARTNLLCLLLTNKGERLIHSDMGCDLGRFLFEQQTSTAKKTLEENIRSQVGKWLPYVKIDTLTIDSTISNGFQIKIRFSLINFDNVHDVLEIIYEP